MSSTTSSLPQLAQIDEWIRSLSPVQPIYLDPASPDMFLPASPVSYAQNVIKGMKSSSSPPRQSQIDEWLQSKSPISSSITQHLTDWADDGYNDILVIHMIAHEKEWSNDGADRVFNHHMNIEKMNYEKTNFVFLIKYIFSMIGTTIKIIILFFKLIYFYF